MNKNLLTTGMSSLGPDGYVSPIVNTAEIQSEGLLCSSFQEYDEIEVEW